MLQITKQRGSAHPLVARASVWLPRHNPEQFATPGYFVPSERSQFIVGMVAPTSGDSLGTGERSGPRSLGVESGPDFHISLDLSK